MKYIAGYCPYCKSEIQINKEKKNGICPFCGKTYNTLEVIKNIKKIEQEKNNQIKSEDESVSLNTQKNNKKTKIIGIILCAILFIIMLIGICILFKPQKIEFGSNISGTNNYEIEKEIVKDVIKTNNDIPEESSFLLNFAFNICRFLGIFMLIFSFGMYISAMKNDEPEDKARSISILLSSVMLIFLPTIYNTLL